MTEQSAQGRMLTGAGASHSHAARGDDLYETPREAVDILLAQPAFAFARDAGLSIWEPAAGKGAIVRPLESHGFTVIGTDLVDYGSGFGGGRDFLKETTPLAPLVVTNPPFKLAADFVQHALDIGVEEVWLLLRLAFAESVARRDILDTGHWRKLVVCTSRLPMMHRDGWTGKKIAAGGIPFGWFCWKRETGPTVTVRSK